MPPASAPASARASPAPQRRLDKTNLWEKEALLICCQLPQTLLMHFLSSLHTRCQVLTCESATRHLSCAPAPPKGSVSLADGSPWGCCLGDLPPPPSGSDTLWGGFHPAIHPAQTLPQPKAPLGNLSKFGEGRLSRFTSSTPLWRRRSN